MPGGRTGRRRRQAHSEGDLPPGPELVLDFPVRLEDLYNGAVHEVAHRRQVRCAAWFRSCEHACNTCGGRGIRIVTRQLGPGFVQQIQSTCDVCGGRGRVAQEPCAACPHGQFETQERVLMVDVERGAAEHTRIPFEGEGDEGEHHAAGTVVLVLRSLPHRRFWRGAPGTDGAAHLHHNVSITLAEALGGFERNITHLDGRAVRVARTRGHITRAGDVLVLRGEGMSAAGVRAGSSAGDLHVHLQVQMPRDGALSVSEMDALLRYLPKSGEGYAEVAPRTLFMGDAQEGAGRVAPSDVHQSGKTRIVVQRDDAPRIDSASAARLATQWGGAVPTVAADVIGVGRWHTRRGDVKHRE
eukprot:ctg_556.g281